MGRIIAVASLMLGLFVGAVPASAQVNSRSFKDEQREFFVDNEGFTNSEALPKAVLNALTARREASYARDFKREHPDADLNQFFKGIPIHLAGAAETDYIVSGILPLSGADNDWFWIVRDSGRGARVLLFANGNGIELSSRRSKGYRNIRSVWSSAAGDTITCVYKFDGKKYLLWKRLEKMDK